MIEPGEAIAAGTVTERLVTVAFCQNVQTLPIDMTSTFIRSERGGFGGQTGFVNGQAGPGGFASGLGSMSSERAAGCGSVPGRR